MIIPFEITTRKQNQFYQIFVSTRLLSKKLKIQYKISKKENNIMILSIFKT